MQSFSCLFLFVTASILRVLGSCHFSCMWLVLSVIQVVYFSHTVHNILFFDFSEFVCYCSSSFSGAYSKDRLHANCGMKLWYRIFLNSNVCDASIFYFFVVRNVRCDSIVAYWIIITSPVLGLTSPYFIILVLSIKKNILIQVYWTV